MVNTKLILLLLTGFVLVSCSRNRSLSGRNSCKKSFARSIFSKRHDFTIRNAIFDGCNWLNDYKKGKRLCAKKKGLAQVLWNARKLAVKYCENDFRYDQWNCSVRPNYFKDFYRETAYMHALSAAALMYSISISCSEKNLLGCGCADRPEKKRNNGWRWGGCGDNVKYGRKFARKFLKRKKCDRYNEIIRHNYEVGYRIVLKNMQKNCTCPGGLGTCSEKICWKTIKPFRVLSGILKKMYHSAIYKSYTRNASFQEGIPMDLIYLKMTPNLCPTTFGRRCNDTDNCATLCCGRGFNSKSVQIFYPCECRWSDPEIFNVDNLVCKHCSKEKDVYYCK